MDPAQVKKALDLLEAGEREEGLSLLNELVEHQGMTDELRYEISMRLYSLGYLNEAIQLMTELSERYPEETELKLNLAEYLSEVGQEEEALALLQEVPEEDSNRLAAVLLEAEIHLRQGLPEVAEYKVRQLMEHYPEEPLLYHALGEIFFEQQDFTLALLNFKRSEEPPIDRLAICYARLGQFEEALYYYREAIKQHREPSLLFGAGFVSFQLEEWEGTVTYLEELINIDPYYVSAYPLLGQAYIKLEHLDQALKTFKQGIGYDDTNAELYYWKGVVLARTNQVKQAKEAFLNAVQKEPEHSRAWEGLLELDEEDPEEKLSFIKRLLDLFPQRVDLWLEQGKLYEELEHWIEAENSYKEALQLDPDDVDVINHLAQLLRAGGQREEAIQLWTKSLQIKPDQWEIEELLHREQEE